MTPLETELLQQLGIDYLQEVERISIFVVFYGALASLVDLVYGSSTRSTKGVFVILFSASVVIFVSVSSFLRFLVRPDTTRFHRRRGFSNRTTAAMFIMTVINFLLSSLHTGTEVVAFTVFIRKALIEYPLSEKPELVLDVLQNLNIVIYWSENLPVSSNLSPLESMSIHTRWRYYSAISLSFGGLGSSSKIDSE